MDLRQPRAECMVQKVVLRWDRFHAKAYKLQVSTDAGPSARTGFVEHWTDIYKTADGRGGVDEIVPPAAVKARYVRLFCTEQGTDNGFAPIRLLYAPRIRGLRHGRPGAGRAAASSAGRRRNVGPLRRMEALQRVVRTDDAGQVSTCGYDDSRWLPAVVPGTVLTSYLAAGAIPDMFYGDHQFQVSDWFCRSRLVVSGRNGTAARIIAASGYG